MRYDAGHKTRIRDRILSEAAQMIRENGPHRVSVAALMARASLTHGGFYAHFPSKDALVAAAIGQMFLDASARLDPGAIAADPKAGLKAYLERYLSRSHRDAPQTGCPLPALAADLPRLTEPARDAFSRGLADLTGRLAEALRGLGHPDADELATSMLAEMVGAVALARGVSDPAQSDEILRATRRRLKLRARLAQV